jgi:hypothetical protein
MRSIYNVRGRVISLTLVAATILLVLSGCSDSGGDPTPATDPEERVTQIVRSEIGSGRDVVRVSVNDFSLMVQYQMSRGQTIGFAGDEMVDITCALKPEFPARRYNLVALARLIDAAGNEVIDEGLEVFLEPETVDSINCANAMNVNIEGVADSWEVHPALR